MGSVGAGPVYVESMTPAALEFGSSEGSLLRAGVQVRSVREIPPRPGRTSAWPDWVAARPQVLDAVGRAGVTAPWAHQVQAAEALWQGRHLSLTTGTASGKSLAYLMPIMAAVTAAATPLADVNPPSAAAEHPDLGHPSVSAPPAWRRRRPATSVYLAPTKALAHDQARLCDQLGLPGWRVATVDGDTDSTDRQWARDHAHHLLTNPDLLHASLLPQHQRWAAWLRSLRFVVVDESHRYRGVFGAQVASVLRRLRRVAAHYGATPTFAVVSATVVEPIELASSLTGLPPAAFVSVDRDTSVRGPVRIGLGVTDGTLEEAAAAVMADQVRDGRQVLTFVPSRRRAEEVARSADRLAEHHGIVAYRAGYLAADRRLIERGLADRTVRGVAATNALELGVDIAGLDTVVMCGYPGSRTAFWQQAGRAGRRGSDAEVLMLARPTPLDAYLLDHPEALFDQPLEVGVLDPSSPAIVGPQLAAAAQELPLRPGDEHWFGPITWPLVRRLTERGVLRRRPDGWYWTAERRAVDAISLRSGDGRTIDIVEEPTGRVLGQVAAGAADLVVHPGAVYLHQGETYVCAHLDEEIGEAFVRPSRPGYLTQPVVDTEIRLTAVHRERTLGGGRSTYGPAEVRSTVTGFLRRDEATGQVWDSTPLDRPAQVLATMLTALIVPAKKVNDLNRSRLDAGAHALEHLCAGILPAIVANAGTDVGANSWIGADGSTVVVVFDRQPGSGFAARAHDRAETWLSTAATRINECECTAGCPACILLPGCGSTRPLDKGIAQLLLAILTEDPGRPD
ncbi:MAG: DEAD/DEAH box helicase [Microlunatus sp.]|nr:DEAD/DEAH box helicase [Microlunatus sp.]